MFTRGKNVTICEHAVVGEQVVLEDDVYVDAGAIIKDYVHIKKGSYIGNGCIIGEYLGDFFRDFKNDNPHPLVIGEKSVIRSGTILYGGSTIGDCFQTGHQAVVRENCTLGHHVRVGTMTDIQHSCRIGNYVRMHRQVFLGEETVREDFVWLFPGVTITNDPTPPSNVLKPVTVKQYAVVSARAVLLPGITIGENSLVGAGCIVTKDVPEEKLVLGTPGKVVADVRDIINKETGEAAYPWKEHFDRGMPWKGIEKHV